MLYKTRRKLPLRAIVLHTLATAGVIGVALVAPKSLALIKQFDRARTRRNTLYNNIRVTLWRLERQSLVRFTNKGNLRSVELTPKGRSLIDALFIGDYKIPEPAFWDGKWRILTFDMRESRRKARTTLRKLLQGAGFVRLQDSVWVYPYSCDEFVELVRAHLHSGTGELQYFTAEALESDKPLRTHFRLV